MSTDAAHTRTGREEAGPGGLRFCMVTTFYPPYNFGGDGIAVQRLSRALARRGHHVTVVHDADAYDLLSPSTPSGAPEEPPGVEVVRLRSGLGALSPLLTQQLGRPVANGSAIRRLLEEGRFDVIWYHNVSLVGGPGILAAGEAVKIYEAHEHWLVCPTHVLWRHGREPCTGRECLRCVLRHRRPPQLWRYTGLLERRLGHVDAFIAKSEFSRRKHHEFGFARPMEVVPYFLPDPDAEERAAPAPRPHERPYFLFVGRLERIKGLDDVIPLFRDYPDADLLIIGDGDYGEALRARAAGLARVRFLGRLAPEALRAYYHHAEALIVPSVCFETFGIILIEAFRQATPVLARHIGPFPELIRQSGGGMLFTTPEELAAAMRRVQHEPGLRAEMAQSARAAFAQRWSEAAVLPQYLQVIHDAALRSGRAQLAERLHAGAA